MAQDMTRGPITRGLIAFSVPLILSGLLQQLYSWADALIVGNFIGEAPLAAVGATNTISSMTIYIFSGFSVGVSVLTAQAFGKGEREDIPKIASTFTAVIGLATILLAVLGVLFTEPLLRLLNTPEDIFGLAADYLRIVFAGVPFLASYNVTGASLRGVGDSRTPLMAIAVSTAVNVVLDLIFVGVFRWGVQGAAWATVMSQIAMVLFIHLYIRRRVPLIAFPWGRGMIDRPSLRAGLRLGLPAAMQQGVRTVGSMLLQSVQNGFGSVVVAAITSAYRIDTVAMLPVINMGAGMSTFAGQNYGAGDLTRARKGLRAGSLAGIAVAAVITAILVPLGGPILRIFGISDRAVDIGWTFLRTCAIFYPLYGLLNAFTGYLQGLGDVVFVSTVHTAALAVRVGVSYGLRGVWGHQVIAWAEMISWVFTLVLVAGRYWFKHRKGRGGAGGRPA